MVAEDVLEGAGGLIAIVIVVLLVFPAFMLLANEIVANVVEENPELADTMTDLRDKFEATFQYYPFIAFISIFLYIYLNAIRKRRYEEEVPA